MTDEEERDAALKCADEMRIKASEYRQMGFKELASWLRKNADAAMKWAARPRQGQL
jgi:hypothetical protein